MKNPNEIQNRISVLTQIKYGSDLKKTWRAVYLLEVLRKRKLEWMRNQPKKETAWQHYNFGTLTKADITGNGKYSLD